MDKSSLQTVPTVFLVDDQPEVLQVLQRMARAAGFPTRAFVRAEDFLRSYREDQPGCLVLDLRMPEVPGTQVQRELAARNSSLPVIVVTGYAELSECIESVRLGVFDILQKPVREQDLVEAIRRAVAHDQYVRNVKHRFQELTPREHDVLRLLLRGYEMKHIASELGVTFATVAKHRARILDKFGVQNDVELVERLVPAASALGLVLPQPCQPHAPHFATRNSDAGPLATSTAQSAGSQPSFAPRTTDSGQTKS